MRNMKEVLERFGNITVNIGDGLRLHVEHGRYWGNAPKDSIGSWYVSHLSTTEKIHFVYGDEPVPTIIKEYLLTRKEFN